MTSSNLRFLYITLGALVVAVAGLGYYYYQDQQNTASVEITVSDDGISMDAD